MGGGTAVVVETGGTGEEYYRIWSDGRKECWGRTLPATTPNEQVVTFPIQFSSPPKVFQHDNSGPYATDAAPSWNTQAWDVTTTSFKTYKKRSDTLAADKPYYAIGT